MARTSSFSRTGFVANLRGDVDEDDDNVRRRAWRRASSSVDIRRKSSMITSRDTQLHPFLLPFKIFCSPVEWYLHTAMTMNYCPWPFSVLQFREIRILDATCSRATRQESLLRRFSWISATCISIWIERSQSGNIYDSWKIIYCVLILQNIISTRCIYPEKITSVIYLLYLRLLEKI